MSDNFSPNIGDVWASNVSNKDDKEFLDFELCSRCRTHRFCKTIYDESGKEVFICRNCKDDLDNGITLEKLSRLFDRCHVNVIRADNGRIVINGLSQLRDSKDKRQIAKWNVFKDKIVTHLFTTIVPSIHTQGYAQSIVVAYMSSFDVEEAIKEYKQSL